MKYSAIRISIKMKGLSIQPIYSTKQFTVFCDSYRYWFIPDTIVFAASKQIYILTNNFFLLSTILRFCLHRLQDLIRTQISDNPYKQKIGYHVSAYQGQCQVFGKMNVVQTKHVRAFIRKRASWVFSLDPHVLPWPKK